MFGTVQITIGATDGQDEGNWRWEGGDSFWIDPAVVPGRYANWDLDEPNDAYNDEDCGVMRSDGEWNDDDCVTAYAFACRR